jgi:hypothetical protein
MKKLLLVGVMALGLMSFTPPDGGGVGQCFGLALQAYNDAISWGWDEWAAHQFAFEVLNSCAENQQ